MEAWGGVACVCVWGGETGIAAGAVYHLFKQRLLMRAGYNLHVQAST
jgi:hypothetical protein